jgi:hypothetical protein
VGLGAALAVAVVATGVAIWAVNRGPGPGPQVHAQAPAPDARSTLAASPSDPDPAQQAQAQAGPDAALAAEAPPDAGRKPPVEVARPVQLTPQIIATQVARSRTRLLACFERHRDALSSAEGQVTLTVTILQGGSVSHAKVSSGGVQSSPLSACIVEQIKAMRFPAPHGQGSDRQPAVRVQGGRPAVAAGVRHPARQVEVQGSVEGARLRGRRGLRPPTGPGCRRASLGLPPPARARPAAVPHRMVSEAAPAYGIGLFPTLPQVSNVKVSQ